MNSLPDSNFLKALLNSISDIVIAADLEGKIIYWNKGATEAYGYSEMEMIGQPISIIHGEKSKNSFTETIEKLKTATPFTSVFKRITKSGKEVWVDITMSPIKDKAGKEIGILGVGKDITENKKIE